MPLFVGNLENPLFCLQTIVVSVWVRLVLVCLVVGSTSTSTTRFFLFFVLFLLNNSFLHFSSVALDKEKETNLSVSSFSKMKSFFKTLIAYSDPVAFSSTSITCIILLKGLVLIFFNFVHLPSIHFLYPLPLSLSPSPKILSAHCVKSLTSVEKTKNPIKRKEKNGGRTIQPFQSFLFLKLDGAKSHPSWGFSGVCIGFPIARVGEV